MPIQIFDSATAFENNKKPNCGWPRTPEAQAARLKGIAKPRYQPSFRIDRADRIYTIGSCFARNVEAQLIQLGMNVAATDLHFPDHLAITSDRAVTMLNKFVVQSIEAEMRWALEPDAAPFPQESLWELRPGKYVDPFLGNGVPPQALDDVLARRGIITKWFSRITQARLVIITLGLAEAWYDTRTGAYLNIAPPRSLRNADPERLQLHILSYEDVIGSLNRIHDLLSGHLAPDWKMLITVSPVAMGSTFSGQDVLIANTYSKSVQRAAVQTFVTTHDNVDYFPSYESIMLSSRDLAWEEDQAHVSAMAARSNMLRMVEAYVGVTDREDGTMDAKVAALDSAQDAALLAKNGEHEEALRLYEAASARSTDPNILIAHGKFLASLNRQDEAAAIFRKAIENGGGELFHGHYFLGNALRLAGRFAEAEPVYETALRLQPNKPGILNALAKVKIALGKKDEAVALLKRSLDIDPDNASASKTMLTLERAWQAA